MKGGCGESGERYKKNGKELLQLLLQLLEMNCTARSNMIEVQYRRSRPSVAGRCDEITDC